MHVASHYEVGPRFVQGCLEAVASTQLAKRGLSLEENATLPTPRFLGVDEFARRKGHRDVPIFCDLGAHQVLEVSAGRKKDEVASVLERLSNCDGVEAVSMDMSTTFREAVQLCLPRARIVADHFHVIQHVNKAVNKVIGRWAKKEEGRHALEGQRHLFLRNQEDLSAEDEQSRATEAPAFPEIGTAWQLKEALRTWYAEASAETAAVNPIHSCLKRLVGTPVRVLRTRCAHWTKPLTSPLLLGTLADLARSKSELMAENALLRQQLVFSRA